jgi:hypothetical protein
MLGCAADDGDDDDDGGIGVGDDDDDGAYYFVSDDDDEALPLLSELGSGAGEIDYTAAYEVLQPTPLTPI